MFLDKVCGEIVFEQIVGVYCLLCDDQMFQVGQFYIEDEYDFLVFKDSGCKLLELGCFCFLVDYCGGMVMYVFWNGFVDYVFIYDIEILFGIVSFYGMDLDSFVLFLLFLYYCYFVFVEL